MTNDRHPKRHEIVLWSATECRLGRKAPVKHLSGPSRALEYPEEMIGGSGRGLLRYTDLKCTSRVVAHIDVLYLQGG